MFDDLRDLQPTDSGAGPDPFTSDELLADLPSDADDTVMSPDVAFDEPVGPRFGDDIDFAAAPRRRQRTAFGMTAQQRAVLAVFLFLDVSVLGCAFLLALQKISIP